ncbi:FecR family protein [Lunatibacter salilacus]|uniref:FecR family protein n=1 Tax=Lunatibacter salilacus TaxID=2483804 RepID=UPI00131CA798|nr:FecR domain-containing protein [Lunatibacter salilacus]
MKNFNTVEDFLEDRSFRDNVLRKDPKAGALWKGYLENFPERKEIYRQAERILLELNAAECERTEKSRRKTYDNITQRLGLNTPKTTLSKKPSKPESKSTTRRYAVYLSIALLIGAALFTVVSQNPLNDISDTQEKIQWVVKSNPKGQKSRFHLPDGSSVVVNSESEIRYKNSFGKTDRQLYLVGESFFEVASDSLLPFEVHTRGLVVTALGTAFNINSFADQPVNVQLAGGKVKVQKENDETEIFYLKPGEEIVWDGVEEIKKRSFDLKNAFLWKEGKLRFKGHSISEFKAILERWYGVDIEVVGPIEPGLKIKGEFDNAYLSEVLESVGYAYGFVYKIDQKRVTINFKPK